MDIPSGASSTTSDEPERVEDSVRSTVKPAARARSSAAGVGERTDLAAQDRLAVRIALDRRTLGVQELAHAQLPCLGERRGRRAQRAGHGIRPDRQPRQLRQGHAGHGDLRGCDRRRAHRDQQYSTILNSRFIHPLLGRPATRKC